MVQLKLSGKDKEKTKQHAQAVGDLCHSLQRSDRSFLKSVEVLGPIEAPLPKIAKQYRWQIILKGVNVRPLHKFLHTLWFKNRKKISNRHVQVVVDVDPLFMM
jgi:primosomal protein N' (replication factor Y)